MRRCIHGLLVGVLTFSLSVDAARACGHVRRWQRCAPPCRVTVVVVPRAVTWDGCHGVVVAPSVDPCGCGIEPAVAGLSGCEEIAHGAPLHCCGGIVAVPMGPAVTVESSVVASAPAESVVVPAPTPAAPAAEPVPAAPSPAVSQVPNLQQVAPASATEPAPEAGEPVAKDLDQGLDQDLDVPVVRTPADAGVEDSPETPAEPAEPDMPEEQAATEDGQPADAEPVMENEDGPAVEEPMPTEPEPATEEPAAEPVEEPQPEPPPPNIFEDAEGAGDETVPPAAFDEMPSDGASPAAIEPIDLGDDPADVPVAEPAPGAEDPGDAPLAEEPAAGDEPAAEPGAPEEPATESEPAAEEPLAAGGEPLRRWIDDSASYAVVGRLADVRGDAVRIVRTDGRTITVPIDRLSSFDREYVSEAGPRIAAAAPQPREMARR